MISTDGTWHWFISYGFCPYYGWRYGRRYDWRTVDEYAWRTVDEYVWSWPTESLAMWEVRVRI